MKYYFVAGCGLAALIACGGDSALFGGTGQPNEATGGSAGSTSGEGGSGATSSAQSSSQSSSSSSSSSAAGGAETSGPTTGAGGDSSTGTGGASFASLPCGMAAPCPVDSMSACCWDQWEQHGAPQAECVTGDVENDGCATADPGEPGFDSGVETRIECQTDAHCEGGDVCCAQRRYSFGLQTSFYEDVTCVAANDCDPNLNRVRLCDTPGDTSICPMLPGDNGAVQSVCKTSALLPPDYLVCGYPEGP